GATRPRRRGRRHRLPGPSHLPLGQTPRVHRRPLDRPPAVSRPSTGGSMTPEPAGISDVTANPTDQQFHDQTTTTLRGSDKGIPMKKRFLAVLAIATLIATACGSRVDDERGDDDRGVDAAVDDQTDSNDETEDEPS